MDENKICKCCCSESGRFCPSDVRWRKVVRLINPFVFWSELFMRKMQLLKNPQSPSRTELTQNRVDWKMGRPVEVEGLPPSLSATCKAQQNVCQIHPSLHRRQDASACC